MKRILSLLLVMVMVFSLAMPAMATEPSVNGNTSGEARRLASEIADGKISFTADGSHYYVIAGHEHSFTDKASGVKASDATCTEAAAYYVQCDSCEEHTTEKTVPVGEPLGHDWDDGTVTTKPTCETESVRTYTCKRDSSHTDTRPESAAGHSFTNYESDNNATCRKDGTETALCDHGCGETDTRRDQGSKLEHQYVDGKCIHCGARKWFPGSGDTGDIIKWTGYLILSVMLRFFGFF